jgi:putative membrane protein
MSETKVATGRQRSLAKGLFAGLIGGLAGMVARTYVERILAPQVPDGTTPPTEPIRWGYGATVGAAYGAVAEFYPDVTAKQGASFGLTLGALTNGGAQPASIVGSWPFLTMAQSRMQPAPSLSVKPETKQKLSSEIPAQVAYGIATELTRRVIRKVL